MDPQATKHKIRPAGRHLATIGRDLIKDEYAAIVELVKNAYDADATYVNIIFEASPDWHELCITIEDDGHGMSRDTVTDKWLIPSTDDKLKRKTSPNGREMQGRKGIGRYAAAMLGEDLELQTTTGEGERTKVVIKWEDFEKVAFLDDVEVHVETELVNDKAGTRLVITGGKKYVDVWSEKQIQKLEFELKKLISPLSDHIKSDNSNVFDIKLKFVHFYEDPTKNIDKKIEPFPIFELYDYKIAGIINANGKGELVFVNQKAKNTVKEIIEFELEDETGCGEVTIDLRAFDREGESIELLIKRGLKHDDGEYFGKQEAKNLLNKSNGIGVYRNGFRIRPLGDPDFDWLKLDMKRVQNPSLKIGNNQVMGIVHIQAEEISGLEEKSARDGLKENKAYECLKKVAERTIAELEQRRFVYRQKAGLSRPVLKLEKELERLFEFADLKDSIEEKLAAAKVRPEVKKEILKLVARKEDEQNKLAEDIKRAVAIYQGQATLGKIINVVLHEGRKPIGFLVNHIPNIKVWLEEVKGKEHDEAFKEVLKIINGTYENAKMFVQLFKRLDPLAAAKRGDKQELNIQRVIEGAFHVFDNELISKGIKYEITCDDEVSFYGWGNDIQVLLTNLIENSMFWLNEMKKEDKKITIVVTHKNKKFDSFDYRDNGPGIEKYLIESEVIFEPEFSTKNNGTGLGLAIAGEAATRNNLELKVFDSDIGAYFRLQHKSGD